jgi:23S rRNA C2498 (ribose-2'-O)-methylase RlmM
MNTLFMHCRPGFEGEVCAEISEHAARLGVAGYAKASRKAPAPSLSAARRTVPSG